MALAIRVTGGTGAGCKPAVTEIPADWSCSLGHQNKGRWQRCLTSGCNEKRPK